MTSRNKRPLRSPPGERDEQPVLYQVQPSRISCQIIDRKGHPRRRSKDSRFSQRTGDFCPRKPEPLRAIVSRGGRPDLAGRALPLVKAPTLLIVGGQDVPVIGMNQEAIALIQAEKKLVIVPGATHLFEEFGALEKVSSLAVDWFRHYLGGGE